MYGKMYFVGVDIAWSENNPTGVAVLEGDKESASLRAIDLVETDEEIIEFIAEETNEEDAIVTIDAPLKVPNEEGRRPAEEVVGQLFSKYDAGAHPANRKRLSQWTGRVRGEEMVEKLENEGFTHSPELERHERCRKVMEVYPHPSMVALFDLDQILKYKKKSGRDYDFVYEEFERFQENLKQLENREAALETPEIVEKDVEGLIGQDLKAYEDKLDALFCAYIAYSYWKKPVECEILGNQEEGYILTPVKPEMKEELRELRSQKDLEKFG